MNVFVIGLAVHPAASAVTDKRLEEMVFDTTRAALADAGIRQADVDHVTIAASDELDGRAISSMLLAMPAGAYLRDETKCTDSGLTGLCLGAMRVESGVFHVGLVVSWNKTSEAPLEEVMRMRSEPFYSRPVGLNMAIADGLFAGAVSARYGISTSAADVEVQRCYAQARRNPRGMRRPAPPLLEVEASPYVATPLREIHRAPITDGAVAFVIASSDWLSKSPGRRAKARIAGIGWRSEKYDLGMDRLSGLSGFRGACEDALRRSGNLSAGDVDVVELDAQTSFHHLAFEAALGWRGTLSPSGGAFAQNPYFCTGLVNAAEAVRQVSDSAHGVQVADARMALAHGSHGYAQQGHAAVVFERI